MDLGLYSIYYLYTEFLYQATIEILIDRNRSIGWIISLFHSLHFSIRRFCDECMHVWWWLQVGWKSCIIYGNLIHVAEKIKFSFNIVYFIQIPCKSGDLFVQADLLACCLANPGHVILLLNCMYSYFTFVRP